jgi:imidazolonepropionase-like amidohydrolase
MTAAGRVVVAGGLVLALAGCRAHLPAVARLEASEPLTIVDVNVVDGTGGAALSHQDVVVEGDRIVAIAPTGGPVRGRAVEGAGRTVLPGFVDAHTHVTGSGGVAGGPSLTARDSLQRYVLAGVTTVFDLGAPGEAIEALRAEVADDDAVAPRLFHTHLAITGRGSHPIPLADAMLPFGSLLAGFVVPQVGDEADIPRVLDEAERHRPDFIKIMADRMPRGFPVIERALLAKLIGAARARGHLVFVHAGDVDDAVAAAEAGATALAHLPWRGTLDAALAARIRKSGAVVFTTAAVWEKTATMLHGNLQPSAWDRALVPAPLVASLQARPEHPKLISLSDELDVHAPARAASLRALIAAGVPLVVGTDSVLPGVWPGSTFVEERRVLLQAGVTPAELVVAMTSRPARLVAGDDADFGVIAPGKAADLVVVDGDPLADPSAFERVVVVVRQGRVVTPLVPLP